MAVARGTARSSSVAARNENLEKRNLLALRLVPEKYAGGAAMKKKTREGRKHPV